MDATLDIPDPVWVEPKQNPDWCQRIMEEFNLPLVAAQILVARGFTSVEEIHHYLYAKLPDLLDPYLMNGMEAAVERVLKALRDKENVLIYGDNDVDGMTGTALLTEFFREVGGNAYSYISNRNMLRQSIVLDALEFALTHQCTLIITVDCGITASQEVSEIAKHHVDVIITDHHEPTAPIPQCVATLNPKLVGSTYPNRDITGVGVAFKLAHAVTNALVARQQIAATDVDLKRYLDLVALGTISDMGALLGENRILVRYGLEELRRSQRIGLSKLVSVCDLTMSNLTTIEVASKIAPRLNSLGRIADPQKGVELLLVRHEETAERLAKELDLNNIERQKIERTMSVDVEATIRDNPEILNSKAVVMYSNKWHPGVIAIVTTRITKLYNRPTVMIAIENGVGKGSIRSIPEFPLLATLKESADILINFGGHDFAAGLTIKEENIELFKERFLAAADQKLKEQDVLSKLYLDSKVNFDDLTFDFMEALKLFEPFGNENAAPVLYCNALQVWPPKVVGKTHLKLFLEQRGRVLEGIAFGMAKDRKRLRRRGLTLKAAFTPQINNFQNKASIQLMIRHYKIME